jgi:hypothetical protein
MNSLTIRTLTAVAIAFALAGTSFAQSPADTKGVYGEPALKAYFTDAVGFHPMDDHGATTRGFVAKRGIVKADFDTEAEIGSIVWAVKSDSATVKKARGLVRVNSKAAGRKRSVDPKSIFTLVVFDLEDPIEPDEDEDVTGVDTVEISEMHGITGKKVTLGWVTFAPNSLPEVQTYSNDESKSDDEYTKIIATFETMHLAWSRTKKMRTGTVKGSAPILASGRHFPLERKLIREFYTEANYASK